MYMNKITKNFNEKSAFRVLEFVRSDPFLRMLFSLRAKGTSRKDKKASVVSIFRHSNSVRYSNKVFLLVSFYFSPSHTFVPFHCNQASLSCSWWKGEHTKRISYSLRSLHRKEKRLVTYLWKRSLWKKISKYNRKSSLNIWKIYYIIVRYLQIIYL